MQSGGKIDMKIYDLSQPLNEQCPFWPYYPPFEVKYIKRKAEHGVNAQYIMTSNHMGTHLDAPRHFVTNGRDDRRDSRRVALRPRRHRQPVGRDGRARALHAEDDRRPRRSAERATCCICTPAGTSTRSSATSADEEKYIHRHPGAHPDMVPWLLEKEIHIWGVDCISTDHPMNLPIGRFLGKGMHGHCDRVRKQAEDKFGGKEAVDKLFPDSAYQLTHNALFPKDCMHIENLGGDIAAPELQNKRLILGCFPWKFKGGEAAFCRAVAFVGDWTAVNELADLVGDRAAAADRRDAKSSVVEVGRGLPRARRAAQPDAQRHRHAESAARSTTRAQLDRADQRRARIPGRCAG